MATNHKLLRLVLFLFAGLFSNLIFAAPEDHFVTTWKVYESKFNHTIHPITVPMVGGPYDVDWDNDGTFDEFGLFDSVTHDFDSIGTYTIRIRGTYDAISIASGNSQYSILSLDQWGTNVWKSMSYAFAGAGNLVITATDRPNFSSVTDMSHMFQRTNSANPDTSDWDTSSVTDMAYMFEWAISANPDTSAWDTSSVTDMGSMFSHATLANPDTSGWDTSSVTDMGSMFSNTTLANPVTSGWDTSAVRNMLGMFARARLANPDTSGWDTSLVENMGWMFWGTPANPDTSGWDTAAVTNMWGMFGYATLANPDVNGWDTAAVTDMSYMFRGATSANPDVSGWDTAAVTDMSDMFWVARSANPDTSGWNTAAVTDMSDMFSGARLANPDTSGWNTSAVQDMSYMFAGARSFDQDIGSWDVTSLTNASSMFGSVSLSFANYEKLLIGWNTQVLQPSVHFSAGESSYCSTVATAARANIIASYSWIISDGGQACPPVDPGIAPDLTPATDNGVSDTDNITTNGTPAFFVMCSIAGNKITLYTDNPAAHTRVGTHVCTASGTEVAFVTTSLVVGLHNIIYTDRKAGAESGTSPSLAIIIEPQGPAEHFVSTWKTDNVGTSSSTSITLPMVGGAYEVDWNNDGVFDEFGLSNSVTHDFGSSGIYTIRVRGTYDFIRFDNSGDKYKILSLDQWGTNAWKSMNNAFSGATNLVVPATDTLNLSAVTDMSRMFERAYSANPDTSGWDTSSVINMDGMFARAASANPDTSGWDTSAVRDMSGMFALTTSANPDTSGWDTSSVTDMSYMFYYANSAIPDTSGWDTSSVRNMDSMFANANSANPYVSGWDTSAATNMAYMFYNALAFNRDIGSWNVSQLTYANKMFSGATISADNYDNLLIGWAPQVLQSGVTFDAGNSVYCSAQAIAARANLIANSGWQVTDGGQLCPVIPGDPVIAPDLTAATDSGASNSDDITSDNTPRFEVQCSAIGNIITLYTNNPVVNTPVGSHSCSTAGAEIATVSVALNIGTHNITYTDRLVHKESGLSPQLAITIVQALPTDDFVTTWKTDNPGRTNNTSVEILMRGGPYDVDWNNDGVFDQFNLVGPVTHDYGIAGTYTIRIRGAYTSIYFEHIFFKVDADEVKILSLDQWGTKSWTSMSDAFLGAKNLKILAVDIPDFSAVTNMSGMFSRATSANPDTSEWDTSAVKNMWRMFSGATSANPDTSEWDTSAVTNMRSMFSGATLANPDTSGWNTSSVVDTSYMFQRATSANPNTSDWDTASIVDMSGMFQEATSSNPDASGWDTSAVTFMSSMFQGATSANPDVSGWDTSAVMSMRSMFQGATSANPNVSGWDISAVTVLYQMFAGATAFDRDIGSWDVTSLIYARGMFDDTALSTINYDNLLIGWNAQVLQPSVFFSGGSSNYCSAAATAARANLISSDAWNISDGGRSCTQTSPVKVRATDGTFSDRIRVTFDLLGGATVYRIFRCLDEGDTCGLPIGFSKTGTFDDTDVVRGKVYFYRVKACTPTICYMFSLVDNGHATTAPSQPSGINATDGKFSDRVRVTFNPVEEATVYRVFRCMESNKGCGSPVGYTKTGTFDDTKGTPGTIYYYRVRACTATKCSKFSAVDTGFSIIVPARPAGITATDGVFADRVHMTFNLVDEATVYRVFRCLDKGDTCGWPIGYPKTGIFDDKKGDAGIVYYYRVRACTLTTCGKFSFANSGYRGSLPSAKNNENMNMLVQPDAVPISDLNNVGRLILILVLLGLGLWLINRRSMRFRRL